jgi:SAM-dependent methyltransferase
VSTKYSRKILLYEKSEKNICRAGNMGYHRLNSIKKGEGNMGANMNMDDLVRVNHLWGKIYPYIADHILKHYLKDEGEVLEWGPFSGGISFALLQKKPPLKIQIAVEDGEVFNVMAKELKDRELTGKISLVQSGLAPMAFTDGCFDLVIIRGAYFFLDTEGSALREIYRVMKQGGVGFIGGGYGENVPREAIEEIAEESRILNDRLGRIRVTVEDLKAMIGKAGLGDHIRILEEGGLWLLLQK